MLRKEFSHNSKFTLLHLLDSQTYTDMYPNHALVHFGALLLNLSPLFKFLLIHVLINFIDSPSYYNQTLLHSKTLNPVPLSKRLTQLQNLALYTLPKLSSKITIHSCTLELSIASPPGHSSIHSQMTPNSGSNTTPRLSVVSQLDSRALENSLRLMPPKTLIQLQILVLTHTNSQSYPGHTLVHFRTLNCYLQNSHTASNSRSQIK